MIRLFTVLFLASMNLGYGQVLQNGLILPDRIEFEEICCIYTPHNGFEIYEKPNGEVIGRLTRNVEQNIGDQSSYRIYFVDHKTNTETQIGLENFQEIGYEIWALAYSERRSGFLRIINEHQNFWIKETDIEKAGFKLVEWQAFLSENVVHLLGYYANDPGLNLREQPNTDSRIIHTLKGDTNHISPKNEHIGLWTKVEVIISKEHPCGTDLTEEENIFQELEGWVKIVDDHGRPNVWYYSRGC